MAEVFKDYECCVLFQPELEDEALDQEVETIRELIANGGGDIQRVDRWSKRFLAYEIKGHAEGFYVIVRWFSTNELLPDLEYHLRYNDNSLRHLVIDYTEKQRKRSKRLGKNEAAQV